MEIQARDSKKMIKVFDASRRKKTKKKPHDAKSVVTDDSAHEVPELEPSVKASLPDLSTLRGDIPPEASTSKRRDDKSLALKSGNFFSTPRSTSPQQENETITHDQDSMIYALLEDAIKKDKKKHRRNHKHESQHLATEAEHYNRRESHERREERDRERDRYRDRDRCSRERESTSPRRHRHRHESEKTKEHSTGPSPAGFDQTVLLQTFAELCAQMTKNSQCQEIKEVKHCHSHKSLQCEVLKADNNCEYRPVKLRNPDSQWGQEHVSKVRSQDNFYESRRRSPDRMSVAQENRDNCACYQPYDKRGPKYSSQIDMMDSRVRVPVDKYHERTQQYQVYQATVAPVRHYVDDEYRNQRRERRDYGDFEDRLDTGRRHYEDERKRAFAQKTSRSFDVQREVFADEERTCRRTSRSDTHHKKRYDEPRDMRDKRVEEQRSRDRRYESRKDKYYEEKPREGRHLGNLPSKDRRSRKNMDRIDKMSVVSKDDDYRDRCSERERDSGLSIAETSSVSGRSNCLRVVKQEIAEQREAMDKMMKLWKELMRCFKGMSQNPGAQDKAVNASAAAVQESAAAQLRLWRECMHRYETVARDVGDTDARLMEEINKQRSEMSEMATMWQECLQRYREMSTDFNTLKQQLTRSESPLRAHAQPPPLANAEEKAATPHMPYRMPPGYPPPPGMCPIPPYMSGGSPLCGRASAPPTWWWPEHKSPRRRSSPESRGSRDRDRDRDHERERRRRHNERDDSRYKEKSSKPNPARSEHRHRKR